MKAPLPKKKPLAFNLTSMIDVIFLLLVFFVMSSKLLQEETAMEMDLPRETSGEIVQNDDGLKFVINVENENGVYVGTKRLSMYELKERLIKEKEKAPAPLQVRIRANRDVPYAAIEPILVLCAKTGCGDVSFAVVEE